MPFVLLESVAEFQVIVNFSFLFLFYFIRIVGFTMFTATHVTLYRAEVIIIFLLLSFIYLFLQRSLAVTEEILETENARKLRFEEIYSKSISKDNNKAFSPIFSLNSIRSKTALLCEDLV